MSTLDDVRKAVEELNLKFPRPGIILSVGEPYDIKSEFSDYYPNCGKPGVYVMLNDAGAVLYIGKTSCNSNLGIRLGTYFRRGKVKHEGIAKNGAFKDVRSIATIAVDVDRAWEAPAVEEFLIRKIKPPINFQGRETEFVYRGVRS